MVDGRHIENRCLAISRRRNGRLMRNLDRGWSITRRYRSRDQNCNFCKYKMADGHHFENSFISISQPWIIRFRSKLVCRCEIPIRGWPFEKNEILEIQDRGGTPYWKTFLLYFGAILCRSVRYLDSRCWIACKYGSRDQYSNNTIYRGGSRHAENSFSVFRHIRHLIMIKVMQRNGVLVSVNLWKQKILYRKKTAHSLSAFV